MRTFKLFKTPKSNIISETDREIDLMIAQYRMRILRKEVNSGLNSLREGIKKKIK